MTEEGASCRCSEYKIRTIINAFSANESVAPYLVELAV
jgi:hypothetical protein